MRALQGKGDDTSTSETFRTLGELAFQIGLIFGPQIGYVVQYYEMVKTHSAAGYAPLVSLVLIVSNTLRLYYFIGRPFALALLFQAMVTVIVHVTMVIKVLRIVSTAPATQHLSMPTAAAEGQVLSHVVTVDPTCTVTTSSYDQSPTTMGANSTYSSSGTMHAIHSDAIPDAGGLSMEQHQDDCLPFRLVETMEQCFMQLSPFAFLERYALFATLSLAAAVVYYAIFNRFWSDAPEVVGYLALGIEAMLVVPQILRNARRKSTSGLTFTLVFTWAIGDAIKVVYFILSHQPLAFTLCGCFQLGMDCVVVGQIIFYRWCGRSTPEVSIL